MIQPTVRRALASVLRRAMPGVVPSGHLLGRCAAPSLPSVRHGSHLAKSVSDPKQLGPGEDSNPSATTPGSDGNAHAPPPVVLRPYQTDAIDACLDALDKGRTRIGVSSPTGSGKTTMFMHLIPRVKESYRAEEQGVGSKQTLILVGSVELALQAEAAAARILGDAYTVEVEQSKRVASGNADVTIATYQTLNNPERLNKFDPARFKLVIVDEAHHAASLSYLRLLHYFNDEVDLPSATGPFTRFDHGHKVPVVGFSATFSRHDQLALSAVFEEIVFHRGVEHMLSEGWLSPVKSTAVFADIDLEDVELNSSGEYKTTSLAHHVNTPEINQLVVRTYLHRAYDRRSTLVFAVNLKHVAALVQAFRSAGIDARSISAHTHAQQRKDTIASFAAGEFPVLVNCEVLTEGTDIREIDCIILSRPTRSKNLLAQMVGRGLRLSPETGKEDCYLIDIVDNISRSSGMLVSPTLFGLSHDQVEAMSREEEPRSEDATSVPAESPRAQEDQNYQVTFVDSDDPFRLREESAPVVARMTPNAWVACGRGRYILEMMGLGYLAIEATTGSQWSIAFVQKLPRELVAPGRSPYGRKQHIAMADDIQRAFETADQFASRRAGLEVAKQLLRRAAWRQRPASGKQISMLLKMKGVSEGSEVDQVFILGRSVPIDKLTAGQVAAYVCAVQHGAMGVREKADKTAARKAAKAEAKEAKARELAERNLPLPGVS
ncbi:putative ATP-dependent helicase IRC3 [Vanrija albida]|uniref:ATP-dependent helicase IRC3 n=1 Tax=Vanrija albida TaxID=181172 RepID=A0ABR3Q6G8_9TREE